ncbi:hypothetical protein HU200_027331 [Digitaria exilis]|uniref:F-box/LRR-repeat protein 15/At3g58940/PEG3-like LRR domain-containing protein n=1 Tax=Digitaria exilis TaxID=1010633 RepID=A0A835BW93_9POAL|nr:hypothetical protein HU200_027331 [Digitaria exilis]
MLFLTARQSVQTCVLSRRWRNLWCSMPCLNIDQREFDTAVSSAMGDPKVWECGRFEEFVSNLVLKFHSASSLDMFRCHATHRCQFEVVDRWIRHGIKCSPAVMEISWSPHVFFFGLPNSGSTACRLKRLHLARIALDTGFTQQLCSGCPVLEDLQLETCLLDSAEIRSHSLKSLIVTDCTSHFGTVLTITAPALVSFHLAIGTSTSGSKWRSVIVNEMPSLVEASIRLKSPDESCKLFCSLVYVRIL